MNTYSWKLKAFAKGIDAQMAAQEFERIENLFGSLTAENILAGSTPEDSLLHSLFEWNDDEAANQFRLQQARQIVNNIQVTVISDGKSREVGAYEIVKVNAQRGYKLITTFTEDEIQQVKMKTIGDLIALKNKLRIYEQFGNVISSIDVTIGSLSKIAV